MSPRKALLLLLLSIAGCGNDTLPGNVGTGPGNLGAPCNTDGDCANGDGAALACCVGMCTDTSIDPRHCGGCGMGCPAFANALTLVCNVGVCAIGVCARGFANCDGVAQNGCEADLSSDNANCGRCGGLCGPGPHSSAACAASTCNVTCEPPFGDCNKTAVDGCESDLTRDLLNCGGCGKVCLAPPNAAAVCAAGQCGVGACNPGFGDCDQQPDNGCEADVFSSPAHCGACNKACVVPNASASCTVGQCGIGSCNAGFGDCNMNAADGCEVNLAIDLVNCGACGKNCGGANATGRCAGGACSIVCNPGFLNCNGLSGDGCEVSTNNDPKNCGACGRACAVNQTCVAGVCGANLYAPVGPQTNVPVANLIGWSQCFIDLYNDNVPTLAQIQAACPKAKLMLACRKTGDPTLALLAWAPRTDVLFPVNPGLCMGASQPHVANGTGWYVNGNLSWGFVNAGETINLCNCDTGNTTPEKRLCWHVSGGQLTGGYRCGGTLALNASAAWERVVYQAD